MNHFLHLLILLPALFTTIIALPTSLDDTSNSWLDSPLDNPDTLLAATFGSPDGTLNSPLTSPGLPATTNEELPASPQTPNLPPVKPLEQDWTKPMYLCCRATSWWNDEEKECQISTASTNDSCQGDKRYCPNGYSTSVITDCYRYRSH